MHERLDQWVYVLAALSVGIPQFMLSSTLSVGVIGTLAMVGWSLIAMLRAERRRDAVRRK